MAYAQDIHHFEPAFAGTLTRLRAGFDLWRARRAAFHQTFDELSALTDRDLNDLGLSRYDIARVAREAAAAV